MKLIKINLLLALCLMLAPFSANAAEKHREVTPPRGKVIFFMKVAYPTPVEQLAFISMVHRLKDVKVISYMKQLNEDERREFNKDKGAYMKKIIQPPKSYKADPKKIEKMAKGIQNYKPEYVQDHSLPAKYGVTEFPSFVYLTQDGYLYRFPMKAFESMPSQKQFWNAFNKHKNKTPISKGWNKKWSQ